MLGLRPLTVMVVDDDPDHRLLLGAALQRDGSDRDVALLYAATLSEALERATTGDGPDGDGIDAIVLDLGLPDVPGSHALAGVHLLRALPDTPAIVAVTAGDAGLGLEAVAAGADDFVPKREVPGSDLLLRTVRHAVERRRSTPGRRPPQTDVARLGSSIAHDLRSPLAVALMAFETARGTTLPPRLRLELDEMIVANLRRLATRLDELAEGFDTAADAATRRSDVRVATLVAEVHDLLGEDAGRLHVELRGEDRLWADRPMLRRVLHALLLNTLQHNPEVEVTVTIEVRGDEHRTVVRVQDDGIGLDPTHWGRAFNAGWAAGPYAAAGLGLASVRTSVRASGGDVAIVPGPGDGPAFELTIPQRG